MCNQGKSPRLWVTGSSEVMQPVQNYFDMSQLCKQGLGSVLCLIRVFSGWKLGETLQVRWAVLVEAASRSSMFSFTRAWDLLSTAKGSGTARTQCSLFQSNQSISYTLLNSCSCVMRKAALPSHWKRYDPVNQKNWTLLIYWLNARAGIKSPTSLDQQLLGFMQSSQSRGLQPEPCSSSEEITTLGFLTLIFTNLWHAWFFSFPQLCQVISRVPWKICVTHLSVCFCP